MKKILIISDGKKSSLNQCEALLNELKKIDKYYVSYMVIRKLFFHKLPNVAIYFYLFCVSLFKNKFKSSCDLIISCGRISAPYSLIFKKNNLCRNVHILDPYFRRSKFDRILLPSHDSLNKSKLNNIIITLGTLVNKDKLTKKEKRFDDFFSKKKLVSCFIGGDGRSSKISPSVIKKLVNQVNNLNERFNVVYCFSRRTSNDIKKTILSNRKKEHYCFDYKDPNPYWYLISQASFFIVTSDSISMISDAMSSGKPIYLVEVTKIKMKIKKFKEILIDKGIARKFDGYLDYWNYPKINESVRIAEIINSIL